MTKKKVGWVWKYYHAVFEKDMGVIMGLSQMF